MVQIHDGDSFVFKLEEQKAQTIHIQLQNYKSCVSYVSYMHTSQTKHTVLDLFNV